MDLAFNGINDLLTLKKKVFVVQLEKLHWEHRKVMNDFCKTFKIKYETSSSQLSTIVSVVNKKSNNLYAEHLFKKLSANFFRTEGSWVNSRRLVKNFLIKKIELDEGSFVISDGSGLSSKNKISPVAMVKILDVLRSV